MAQTTSGTVSAKQQTCQQILDHAFRRARFVPEKISGEGQIVALETLQNLLSELINIGWPLWTQEFALLPMTLGSATVPTPQGTVDVIHAYWRQFLPYRGPDIISGGATDTLLFGGQPNTDVVVPGPNPTVTVNLTTPTLFDTIGILPGITGPASYQAQVNINTSVDGATFTTFATLNTTLIAGQWSYFNMDPVVYGQYIQFELVSQSSWTVNQLQLGNYQSYDIELGLVSIDDYYNLPNKSFLSSQVTEAYIDRLYQFPVLKIWPCPNVTAFYNGTISAVMRRYIQDVGSPSNLLELPQRWNEAVIWKLASRLVDEINEEMSGTADAGMSANIRAQQRQLTQQRCEQQAAQSLAFALAEEKTRGPIRLTPSIHPYTA